MSFDHDYTGDGPAFSRPSDGAAGSRQDDMSLRDWFAGQALTGMLAADANIGAHWTAFAEDAYRVADAMLKARKAPGT
jgi:hypothetical protein